MTGNWRKTAFELNIFWSLIGHLSRTLQHFTYFHGKSSFGTFCYVKWAWQSRNKRQYARVQTFACILINSHDLFNKALARKWLREVLKGWWEACSGLYLFPQRDENEQCTDLSGCISLKKILKKINEEMNEKANFSDSLFSHIFHCVFFSSALSSLRAFSHSLNRLFIHF